MPREHHDFVCLLTNWNNKVTALLLSLALLASSTLAHESSEPVKPDQAEASASVPLYDNLGDLTYPVTTENKLAQRYFDQGFRLTYAFNHAEALRAFQQAQQLDPNCAMCYWGEALALGPNINAPMDESASEPAVAAINRAQELAGQASPREQALIEALSKRYSDDPDADRAALDQAYAEAMAEVAERFPDDHEISVLYVESLMNLSPWDYWEEDGETPKGKSGEAVKTTERVLAGDPNHPGAIHLYIHLVEASAHPERAEPYADRLAELMPGAGHIVHMPSHIYFRIGRFHDSIETNQAAVEADEKYLATVDAEGIYPYGYYPHNIHFVIASAQMVGDKQTALDYVERLEGKIPDEFAEEVGWVQHIKTAPYFTHVQFSDPETILALPDPGDRFPLVKAMWHYARGVGFAGKGDLEGARSETARIAEINQTADFSYLLDWMVPAPDLLNIAHHVLVGRIAQAEGDFERAAGEFESAVAIQDTLPYMEPPYWYYPVRQSLGAALLQADKAEEAEQAFQRALEDFPNNGWSLYGLMEAQKAQGNEAVAKETKQHFEQAWAGDPDMINLNRL